MKIFKLHMVAVRVFIWVFSTQILLQIITSSHCFRVLGPMILFWGAGSNKISNIITLRTIKTGVTVMSFTFIFSYLSFHVRNHKHFC